MAIGSSVEYIEGSIYGMYTDVAGSALGKPRVAGIFNIIIPRILKDIPLFSGPGH